jgi:hypothetical protein
VPIIALPAVGAAVYLVSAVLNRTLNDRYAYLPIALLIAALGIAAARAAEGLETRNAGRRVLAMHAVVPAVALLLVVGFAASFVLTARASTGPDVRAEIGSLGAACAPGLDVVSIDISPKPASDHWTLPIPCDRLR